MAKIYMNVQVVNWCFLYRDNEWSKTWSNYDEGSKSEWSQWMKHKECEENYKSEALRIETLMLIRYETQNMQ